MGGDEAHGDALDEVRRRRRARLASHLADPTTPRARDLPDPAAPIAPAEHLRARLAATDREGRFRQRLVEVQRQDARRRRRSSALRAGGVVLALVACAVAGAVVGILVEDGVTGTAVGLLAASAFLVGRVLAARAARARGSEAWDWQAGRHRLLGRPARRVQDLDRPRTAGPFDPRR